MVERFPCEVTDFPSEVIRFLTISRYLTAEVRGIPPVARRLTAEVRRLPCEVRRFPPLSHWLTAVVMRVPCEVTGVPDAVNHAETPGPLLDERCQLRDGHDLSLLHRAQPQF